MARIQPGLERIAALLKGVDFPWRSIHVAGTNGKGSICHYASSMLVGRSVKVGKFTSPHLMDRWDCISINGKPVTESKFRVVERHFLQVNDKQKIGASPFEILTATAFTIFNDTKVKVGVIEVGMGGRLDSTNILDNQAVSVISKIARDHESFLGSTLSEIAAHKAGILRPGIPYIINPGNEPNVQAVIQDYGREIGAGPQLLTTSFDLDSLMYGRTKWARATAQLLPFQQENLKLAVVAVMQSLTALDREAKPRDLAKSLILNAKLQHRGRQEMVRVTPVFQNASDRRNQVLVDGAHNPDAAIALDSFVSANLRYGQSPGQERPPAGWPVTWVLAMTEGKDARAYLATLLKPGDNVVTTAFGPVDGMPWVKPMDPKELLELAKSVEPQITGVHVPVLGALRAVCTAKYMSDQLAAWSPIVLTGSLYLVGDLHRELQPRAGREWWTDPDPRIAADRDAFMKIQAEERERAGNVLKLKNQGHRDSATDEQTSLQEELDRVNRELDTLEIEGDRAAKDQAGLESATDGQAASAAELLGREDLRFAELFATPEQIAAHVERAERLRKSLIVYQEKNAIAARERDEKREKKRERKERLAERKEKRTEKRKREKEMKARNSGGRPGYVPKDVIRERRSNENADYRFSITRRPPRTSDAGPDHPDALSGLEGSRSGRGMASEARSRKSEDFTIRRITAVQGMPSSAASQAPSVSIAHVQQESVKLSENPREEPSEGRTGVPRDSLSILTQDGGSSKGDGAPARITMHYANVRQAQLARFPKASRTKAWSPGDGPGDENPSRASVVSYYAHDYRDD
ncbi:hypothetical protein OPT61_g10400 [Boeremia exigua]|uniref:Uncharacterized protein n=1 Tax=Boeremia exigua TaxID=749465 RepID=A0ACC2HQN6_9PLEO|nr:hypothetical protein OPT61_g10400 [Boeremia exigua]